MRRDDRGTVFRGPREGDQEPLPRVQMVEEQASVSEHAAFLSIGKGNQSRQNTLMLEQTNRKGHMRCLPPNGGDWRRKAAVDVACNSAIDLDWRRELGRPGPIPIPILKYDVEPF